jgi:tRNA(Ile2) C34 agmatinyltransferase TiaS
MDLFKTAGSSPPRTKRPSLDPTQIRTVHRSRYPDGLVCDVCGRLLASTGYALRPYTCAECRSAVTEAARAFERLKAQPRRLTDAQLTEADAYCTWCRRWFNTEAGGGGLSCDPCRVRALATWRSGAAPTDGSTWALHEIPAPTGPRKRQLAPLVRTLLNHDQTAPYGSTDPVRSLRAGSSRQIRSPEEPSRLLGRSGRVPRRRKVSEASLAALKRINARRRKAA